MNNSASRFSGFGFSEENSNTARRLTGTRQQYSSAHESASYTYRSLNPVLLLHRAAQEGVSTALLCASVRETQRNYYLLTRNQMINPRRLFVIHERMPAHQQDYVIECLDCCCNSLGESPVTLLTTTAWLATLLDRLPWLEKSVEIIPAAGAGSIAPHHHLRHQAILRDDFIIPGAFDPPIAGTGADKQRSGMDSHSESNSEIHEPTVSCICLREGDGGRWLLTDHGTAAVVRPDEMPPPQLLPRLLSHCVDISGRQLAPHLARNFDVPDAWKIYPELATKSLLIFRKNRCLTHGDISGIPKTIIWSDLLGLIY